MTRFMPRLNYFLSLLKDINKKKLKVQLVKDIYVAKMYYTFTCIEIGLFSEPFLCLHIGSLCNIAKNNCVTELCKLFYVCFSTHFILNFSYSKKALV